MNEGKTDRFRERLLFEVAANLSFAQLGAACPSTRVTRSLSILRPFSPRASVCHLVVAYS